MLLPDGQVVRQATRVHIQAHLLELGVHIHAHRNLLGASDGQVELGCVFTERRESLAAAALVLVTARLPEEALYLDLTADPNALDQAGIELVRRIGDCLAPGTIAAAVHDGHLAAREMDAEPAEGPVPFRREDSGIAVEAAP